jgi:hypothetical protein
MARIDCDHRSEERAADSGCPTPNLVRERWHAGPGERVKDARERLWLATIRSGLACKLVEYHAGREIELVEKERVRIDDLDLERVHAWRRKVVEVERHDAGGIRSNGSSEDVAVFRIAGQSLDERAVTRHFGIRERATHLSDEPVDVTRVNAGLDQVSVKFINDVG